MKISRIKNKDAFIADLKTRSVKEVALKYRLSVSMVYRLKRRYGLNVYFSDCVPTDFVEYAKTHNKKQAAEKYSTSYAIIRKWEWLADCKCSKKRGSNSIERDKRIKELTRNYSYSEIGKMYGITKQRVEQIVNQE